MPYYRFLIFLFFSVIHLSLLSQEFIVEGKVVDVKGSKPLPFVNIILNNGNHGGTTDIDGKFYIKSGAEINKLAFRYVGYKEVVLSNYLGGALLIAMQQKEIALEPVTIYPGENPAYRIMDSVMKNRDLNNPLKQQSFTYDSYNKIVFTIDPDYFNMNIPTDSLFERLKVFVADKHFFIMESVTKRRFMQPDKNYEKVIASRVSGFQNPVFTIFASQLQSFSCYEDYFNVGENRFLNPVSKGSKEKYVFIIQDTLFPDQDSVFILSYFPRKGKNFDGLKGLLYIHTNKWAVQNIIAEPYEEDISLRIKVEQKYELIEDKQWFPVQLNTDIIIPGLFEGKMDMVGNVRGYLSNVYLDTNLSNKAFSNIVLEMDGAANRQSDSVWNAYRVDSLTNKDIRTYAFMDSIGRIYNFDQIPYNLESITNGNLPLGVLELNINRMLAFNNYEGLRLGLGLHTANYLSPYFKIGGYFGYGFKDKKLKYGADANFLVSRNNEIKLYVNYMNDLVQPGNHYLSFLKFRGNDQLVAKVFMDQWDRIEEWAAGISFRTLRYMKVYASLGNAYQQPVYDYAYSVSLENILLGFREFYFTEASLGFRYAYKEKLIRTPYSLFPTGTQYPVLYFQYSKGLDDFLQGQYAYERIDLALQKSFHIRHVGESEFFIFAGKVKGDVPISRLYAIPAGWNAGGLYVPRSYNTMRICEYMADEYLSIYYQHSFGKLLFKTAKFKPEVVLLSSMAWGTMQDAHRHKGIEINGFKKGYFESGFFINNILDLGLYSLGFGAFYRYGPVAFPRSRDNVSLKWSVSGPLINQLTE